MTTPHTITDAMLGLPHGQGETCQFHGHFDGHPDQWRAYLDTLATPPDERPVHQVAPGAPIVTLYGYWWQPGLDDLMAELFTEAGYDVHIVQTIGDVHLLPRHPVGHIHVRGDLGERTWFVIGGHVFSWRGLCGLASATREVQDVMGVYVAPGDEIDFEAAAVAETIAADLARHLIPAATPHPRPDHTEQHTRELEGAPT